MSFDVRQKISAQLGDATEIVSRPIRDSQSMRLPHGHLLDHRHLRDLGSAYIDIRAEWGFRHVAR